MHKPRRKKKVENATAEGRSQQTLEVDRQMDGQKPKPYPTGKIRRMEHI